MKSRHVITSGLLFAASLSLSISAVLAQDTPPVQAEIRLLAFSPELQQAEAYAQDPAGGDAAASVSCPIKSYLNHEFSQISLKSRKIAFTTKADRASLTREGELLGEVTLPDAVNSAILLFLPGKSGDRTKFKVLAINDSKRAFPSGSYHISNLSPLPVRLMLEQKLFEFRPGQTIVIENPPVRESGQSGMRTFAFKDNTWVSVATGLWSPPGQSRGVRVMFQNPTNGDIQLRAFDDDPPREPKQDKPAQ